MAAASCATCGDLVRYNPRSKGWYHHDSNIRDHSPAPHDGRSGEADVIRETAQRDQLKAKVRDNLQTGCDHLHAEKTVNDLFNDRRS